MNEKNKNEKTFADLFSTISKTDENKSSDSNQEQTTLNDLFNQKTEEKEIKFSNLNIKEEDNVTKPELSPVEKEEEISFNNMLINSKKNETKTDDTKEFDLFDFNNKQVEPEEDVSKQEAIEEYNEEKDNNTKFDEQTENNILSNIEEEQVEDEENNIFTTTNSPEEKDNNTKFEEQTENNIFTNINTEESESTKDQESQPDNNIFISQSTENSNNNSEEINMFVNSNTTEEKKSDESETNMFLNESPTETKDNNKEVELPKETTEPKPEESPFFTDTTPSDNSTQDTNNPFFENKINLIENEKLTNDNTTIDTSNIKHFNVKIVNKKEPLIKFIIGVISYAIFILLLLIGITLLVYVADLKIKEAKGDTTPPKYNAFVVLTGSMLPEIQVYDVVITKKIDTENLKEGDVITFSSSDSRFAGTTITHRIIKVNKPTTANSDYTFQTKGDNNNVADSALVQANNIYGKVIFKIPKLGYLQEFLASDGGWILVILLPCLAVVSYDIVTLAKGIKRKKYKKLKVQK